MIEDVILISKVIGVIFLALMGLATIAGVICYMFKDKINEHFGEIIIK